jgi:gliding motility-associated-like protein
VNLHSGLAFWTHAVNFGSKSNKAPSSMKRLLYLPALAACFLLGISLRPPSSFQLVEICDNALDDDGDGLADLNDPDCDCPVAEPVSLIPNPSFEEKNCCPPDRSRMDCAVDWIQASEATTDYLHTCGWMGWPDLPPPPLPFPDGEGCVGFRNGRIGGPNGDPARANWKEYAGACLTGPLKAGVSYRFEFYIGFTQQPHSPPTTIVFFGSTDCVNLPFGVGNPDHGCPLNGPGWIQLGSVPVNGTLIWKLKEITVTPTQDIHAIAIGPNCSETLPEYSYYYFFDNLVLAEEQDFNFKITDEGHPCSENITLKMPYRDTLQYQWYKDGVALPGKTGPTLTGVHEEGDYQVRVLGPHSCQITKAYRYQIPVITAFADQKICKEDTYFFDGKDLSTSGFYWDTLKTAENCDSIIRLNLEVLGENIDTVFAKIFDGESYRVGSKSFSEAGEYRVTLTSSLGCDSLVYLVLDYYKVFVPNAFSPNGDGFNDVFSLFSGADVKEILNMKVFDRWGGLVFEKNELIPNGYEGGWDGTSHGKPMAPGVYIYEVFVVFDDGKQRLLKGAVNLMR